MLTEKDAVAALPPSGFIRTYVAHAYRQTTAPLAYHFNIGLAILASTCPLAYGMYFAGGSLRSNIFAMLVGESGEAQKSTAVGIGRDILFDAASGLVGDFPGSAEALFESLADRNSQCIPISEFGRLLSSAQRGYFEPVKPLLTDFWDANPMQKPTLKKKALKIENPRLSIIAGCSMPYLEKYTLAEDWTGGFMGRWTIMYADRERTDAFPVGNPEFRPSLVNFLKDRASTPAAGWCTGLTPAAMRRWREWFDDVSNRNLPRNILGIRSRAPTMALKVALIYGWDFGPAIAGEPWQIDLDVLEPAITFIEMHIKSLVCLSRVIADHPDARLRRTILDTIRDLGGSATLGQILLATQMRKRPIAEMLDALTESSTVLRHNSAEHGTLFTLSHPDAG